MNDGHHFGYRFLLLGLILVLNGFFAAAEVSLLSVRKSRLGQLAEAGNVGAQAALNLLHNPERLLSVTQFGVTLASLGLGWAGEETLFSLVSAVLSPIAIPGAAGILHGVSFALSFALMSYGHVVIGEVVPKNLAIEKADRLAVVVSPVLLIFYRISEPFVAIIEKSAAALGRLIGLKGAQHGGGHSSEELRYIIESSSEETKSFEHSVMSRVLDIENYYAREIMVPRRAIVSVSADATLDGVLRAFLEHDYSRLPVYERTPENIIGVVHFKDLMHVWEERKQAHDRHRPVRPFRLRRVIRKPLVVPETKPLNQLIDEFRSRHTHLAIVVDEFGTISGLVTLEDALEQVFGEIEDEHDELRRTGHVTETGAIELDGATNIRDLAMHYRIELPGDAGFETLAGFLLFKLGTIPKEGDTVEHGGRTFAIAEMQRNRIACVRIETATPAEVEQPGIL